MKADLTEHKQEESHAGGYILIGVTALLILLAGLWTAKHSGEQTDLRMRRELALYAVSVAEAVDPDLFQELSFTAADDGRPAYRLLCSQLKLYAEAAGLQSLYTMALRDGQVVFGPESLSPSHPYASSPGTVYQSPTDKDFEILETGEPQVQGPFHDEYGYFVTATAPVIDSDSGTVLAAVGVDFEADRWMAAVHRAQWTSAWASALLLAILFAGGLILWVRRHCTPGSADRLRHAETILCAVFLGLLSLLTALYFHAEERQIRRNNFLEQARAQTLLCRQSFSEIGRDLDMLEQFFRTSSLVNEGEFRAYCREILKRHALPACLWIAGDQSKEIFYLSDQVPNKNVVLHDWLSRDNAVQALQQAWDTGRVSAADVSDNTGRQIAVFRWIDAPAQKGTVIFVIRADNLINLARYSGGHGLDMDVCLFELEPGKSAVHLASTSRDLCQMNCAPGRHTGLDICLPVFEFQRAYVLRLTPDAAWMKGHPVSSAWLVGVGGLVITILFSTVAGLITNRRILLQRQVHLRTVELYSSEDRYRRLARHLEHVREDERKHLSRELHDDIGQILTALKIDLVMAEQNCNCGQPVKDKMKDMGYLLSEGIQSIHSLCRRLRPGSLDDLGLEDALFGLGEDWRRRNAVDFDLHVELEDDELPDNVNTAVFRIVQEALTNITRYANASSVYVRVVESGHKLSILIDDDGCGMEPGAEKKSESFGLIGMRERVEMLGGEMQIVSFPGDGTSIKAEIPLLSGEPVE